MLKRFLLRLAISLGLASSLASFTSYAEYIDWRNNRLLPLEKVTVGPSDNYQGRINNPANKLYYTQHLSLISSLVEQNLTTGKTIQLLPSDYDAKEPALAPNNSHLAFTLYRFNALGEICLLNPNNKPGSSEKLKSTEKPQLTCLGKKNTRQWQPFWLGNNQLGFLQQQAGKPAQLVVHSLANKTQQVIAEGSLSAPSAGSNAKAEQGLVVYSRSFANQPELNGLYFYNLADKTETGPLKLDLPGLTSFAQIDAQEEWLYFSQYLNDTNNDQQIDAKDHSVVFRLPLQQALKNSQQANATKPALLPQQLTSVAQNCTFPGLSPSAEHPHLYLTCDFEGSLDNYRLPLTGQLPASWTLATLQAAHEQAQSYEERLLLINNQRYLSQTTTSQHLEALLSNHLELNELTAAQHYLHQLIELNPQPALAEFYQQLNQLLNLQSQALQLPQGVITASFNQQLTTSLNQLNKQAKHPENKLLFSAWFNYLGKKTNPAKQQLSQLKTTSLHPLQNYLRLKLAEQLFASQPKQLAQIYYLAMLSPQLPSDAKLYYAFQWLRLVDELHPSNTARQQQLNLAIKEVTDPRLEVLLANELTLQQLNLATNDEAERASYQELSKRLQGVREDIQLKRLAHLRGIQLTGAAEKYNYMELISRHWLTTTALASPGFAQTADYYGSINLSRAYGSLAQGQTRVALNSFYALVRQTSSPEGLYQLVYIGDKLDPSLQERKELLVNQLQAEELIANPDAFAAAVSQLSSKNLTAQQLEELAEKLLSYQPQGLNRGTANLVTASVFHRLLKLSHKGYSYNKDYYQQAHYHYMLALDLAYNNPRVAAAVLHNLGQLHFSVRNFGLASQFLGERLKLPFIQPEEELTTSLLLARSLYFSNRLTAAASTSQQALNLSKELSKHLSKQQENNSPALTQLQPLLLEKAAFYTTQAGDWHTAASLYQELLANHQLTPLNLTKATFSQAYLHFQLGKATAAMEGFNKVLASLPKLTAAKYEEGDQPGFSPLRLELQSYGFLAQLANTPEEKLNWLNKRIALLANLKIDDLRLGFDNERRLSLIILAQLQAAEVLEASFASTANKNPEQLTQQLKEAFASLQAWQQADYSLLDQPLQQGLYNLLSFGILHPQVAQQLEPLNTDLANLLTQVYKQLKVEPETPAFNLAQQLKVQLLHTAYLQETGYQQQLEKLMQSPEAEQIKNQRPDLWQELEALKKGLK